MTKAELRQQVWAGTHVYRHGAAGVCAGDSGGLGRPGGGPRSMSSTRWPSRGIGFSSQGDGSGASPPVDGGPHRWAAGPSAKSPRWRRLVPARRQRRPASSSSSAATSGVGKTTVLDLWPGPVCCCERRCGPGGGSALEHYGEAEPYLPLLETPCGQLATCTCAGRCDPGRAAGATRPCGWCSCRGWRSQSESWSGVAAPGSRGRRWATHDRRELRRGGRRAGRRHAAGAGAGRLTLERPRHGGASWPPWRSGASRRRLPVLGDVPPGGRRCIQAHPLRGSRARAGWDVGSVCELSPERLSLPRTWRRYCGGLTWAGPHPRPPRSRRSCTSARTGNARRSW